MRSGNHVYVSLSISVLVACDLWLGGVQEDCGQLWSSFAQKSRVLSHDVAFLADMFVLAWLLVYLI
jgi:hypothetical protein